MERSDGGGAVDTAAGSVGSGPGGSARSTDLSPSGTFSASGQSAVPGSGSSSSSSSSGSGSSGSSAGGSSASVA